MSAAVTVSYNSSFMYVCGWKNDDGIGWIPKAFQK